MSGLCTKEKKAVIEYGFGNEQSKIYLARKTPVEVKAGWGMPPRFYPGDASTYKTAEVWISIGGGPYTRQPGRYSWCYETPVNDPIEGEIIQGYIIQPGNQVEPPSIVLGGVRRPDGFANGSTTNYQLRNTESRPIFGSDGTTEGLGFIEIWLAGVATYKDFGKGQAWYKVKCGNGCVEDEEIQVTEVSSYPGHWCLTDEQMSKLRGADRVLKRTGENLDSYLKDLNAENDRLRRELSKPLPPIRPDPPT